MAQRWKLRYDNFRSMLTLLEEALALRATRPLGDLEEAGAIKRFELCWELAWKVLRDYLADAGSPLDIPSPVNAVRGGLAMGLIADGDGWIAAMQLRNRTTHEYGREAARLAVEAIAGRFAPLFLGLAERLADEHARAD